MYYSYIDLAVFDRDGFAIALEKINEKMSLKFIIIPFGRLGPQGPFLKPWGCIDAFTVMAQVKRLCRIAGSENIT